MREQAGSRDLRRARGAVYALFISFGVLISTWAVHLPALKAATGISTAMMGTVLLVLGVGSIAGMQLTGSLIDRFGAEAVALGGGIAMATAIVLPLSATGLVHAFAGAFLFGLATGCADVGMNAAAVSIERDYGRPIMAAFHGVFSIGTVAGSLLGAAGFALKISTVPVVGAVGALSVAIVGAASLGLRGRLGRGAVASTDTSQNAALPKNSRRVRVLLLSLLAFLLMLAEGSAMDWASLHAQQHLGGSASQGALAVGTFFVAMTIGRFVVDRLVSAFGPVQVLRTGALVACAGITIVSFGPSLPVVVMGWALFALGLAGGVPQVFTAAGNLSGGSSGRTLSRVVGIGYVAILAGPAIIGWLVELISWRGALLVPLCAVVVCVFAAPAVAPGEEDANSVADAEVPS